MNKNDLLNSIYDTMMDYQRENNIKGCGLNNTQFYLDCMRSDYFKDLNLNPIVKSLYTIEVKIENNKVNSYFRGGHLVIFYNDNIIDCNYETNNIKHLLYYEDFKNFKDQVQDKSIQIKALNENLYFQQIADRMNKGEFIYNDPHYYEEQIIYIEDKLGFKFNRRNI